VARNSDIWDLQAVARSVKRIGLLFDRRVDIHKTVEVSAGGGEALVDGGKNNGI